MTEFSIPAVSAFWLGVMTSISPCSLATNILAVSFIDRQISRPRIAGISGLVYTTGRILTYVVLGIILSGGILSVPQLSHFLQKYMNKLLGPVLILTGMILLELIQLSFSNRWVNANIQKQAQRAGIWGAGFLGIIFALSFCPISAALFFGSLVPLSIKYESRFLLPALYGLGTGLPVFIFAMLMSLGVKSAGKAFNRLAVFELWIRRTIGIVFILTGIYYCFKYIFWEVFS